MKNKVLSILSITAVAALLLAGCSKSDIEKANEDYDWSGVIPIIQSFSGPTQVAASGLAAVSYTATFRGGSTYQFSTVGYGATIEVPDADYPNTVDVTWNQSSVDTSALIICVETTAAGLSSPPDTIAVTLTKFCPWDITDFVGTWTGDETGDSQTSLSLDIVHNAADGDAVLRVLHTADAGAYGGDYLPPFLSQVYIGWGERFQTGIGNEGEVLLHMGLLDGSISIDNDYWGQTLPGPYDYWTGGDGTWSGCSQSMHINFGMYWSDDFSGAFNVSSTVDIVKQ